MILTIKENQKHKYIKVRARACSDCGKRSDWVEKQYYIDCDFVNLQIVPKDKNLFFVKNNDGEKDIVPSVFALSNDEPCLCYFYEVSDTEHKEVTIASNISIDKKISFANFLADEQTQVYLSVRAFCTKSETWKSEQVNVYFDLSELFLYTPEVYSADGDFLFSGYLQKNDYIRLCIPYQTEFTKFKYTTDGTDPKLSSCISGTKNGDKVELLVRFEETGDFVLRAVSSAKGKDGKELKQTIQVREFYGVQADTDSVLSIDGENKFILGDFFGGVKNGN